MSAERLKPGENSRSVAASAGELTYKGRLSLEVLGTGLRVPFVKLQIFLATGTPYERGRIV